MKASTASRLKGGAAVALGAAGLFLYIVGAKKTHQRAESDRTAGTRADPDGHQSTEPLRRI